MRYCLYSVLTTLATAPALLAHTLEFFVDLKLKGTWAAWAASSIDLCDGDGLFAVLMAFRGSFSGLRARRIFCLLNHWMDLEVIRQVVAASPNFTPTRKFSLYSNFGRLQETNQVGYRANVVTWQEVLEEAVRRRAFPQALSFEAGPQLIDALSDPQNGQPMALNAVIDEMVAQQKLVPLQLFLSAKYPVLSSTWSAGQLVSKVATWVWGKVVDTEWHSGDVGKLKKISYVAIDQTKVVAQNVLRQIKADFRQNGSTYSAGIFSIGQVKELCGLSSEDLEICLVYLSRETNDLNYDGIIKVSGDIEESDWSIPGIKDILAQQSVRLSVLDAKIAEFDGKARDYLRKGDRERAKTALKVKRAHEKSQTIIMDQQNQLELVLSKIDQATDQINMVEALKAGKDLLAKRNKAVGGADAVSELMGSVQDEIAETDAISEQLSGLSLIDVEDELEELQAQADTQALSSLPKANTLPELSKESQSQSQPEPEQLQPEHEQSQREQPELILNN